MTGFERSRLINKLADLIERDQQELAELESLDNGKPVRIARYLFNSARKFRQKVKRPNSSTKLTQGTVILLTLSAVSDTMPVGQTKSSARCVVYPSCPVLISNYSIKSESNLSDDRGRQQV